MTESKLEGELVVVYLREGKEDHGCPRLLHPELIELGGRTFLTGTLITRQGHWAAGARGYFPLEIVESMIEFETKKAYDTTLARSPRGPKSGWRLLRRAGRSR